MHSSFLLYSYTSPPHLHSFPTRRSSDLWNLRFDPAPRTRSDDEYADDVLTALRAAVKSHLLSDVPVGVFLSGGVDSSGLVALMSEIAGQRIQTFSIGFEEKTFDELELARAVAR